MREPETRPAPGPRPAAGVVLLAAALAAACSDPAVGPAGPSAPAASAAGGTPPPAPPPPVVEWDPFDLRVRLDELVPPPGSGRTRIEGRVVDEEGVPVPGARVEMLALPLTSLPGYVPRTHAVATTGPDGRFEVGPGPEPWEERGILAASAEGYAATSLVSRRFTSRGVWSADPGGDVEVVLRRGHLVSGRARTRAGGPPHAPILVWAIGEFAFHAVVRSDAEGNFSFLAPEGALTVNAVAAEHPGATARSVVTAAGPNEVRLELQEGVDLRGRVVDAATGRPVAGAGVRGYYGETRIAVTDADGRFEFPRYWYNAVQARAPGYAETVQPTSVRVGTGVRPEVEVRLEPGFTARGVVLDLDGRPLRGARLWAHLRNREGAWVDLVGPLTDGEGRFAFVGLPAVTSPKEVRLFARRDMYGEGYSRGFTGGAGVVVDGVEVRMRRLVRWRGVLRDENLAPIRGAVTVTWAHDPALRAYEGAVPVSMRVVAGADGRFALWVPERNPLGWVAEGSLFPTVEGESMSPAWTAERPVYDGPEDIVIDVRRGLSIHGRVVDAAGEPVRAGEIRFEPSPPTDRRRSADAWIRRDGSFEAAGFEPGLYDFSVLGPDEFLQQVVRGVAAGGEPVIVRLRRKGGVRGRVVVPGGLPPGVRPIVTARALESARPLPDRAVAEVRDGEGRFGMGPLAPVPHALTVEAGDWRLDLERVEVAEREPTDLGDLVLVRGGRVHGTVTAGAAPAGGLGVEVYRVGEEGRRERVAEVVTDAAGRFARGGLAAGAYVLSVRPPEFPLEERHVTVALGEEVAADLVVPPGGQVDVTVVDVRGSPVEGARVLLSTDHGPLLFWRRGSPAQPPHATGSDGTLSCSGVAPGRVRVFADVPGVASGEVEVDVVSGDAIPARVVVAR